MQVVHKLVVLLAHPGSPAARVAQPGSRQLSFCPRASHLLQQAAGEPLPAFQSTLHGRRCEPHRPGCTSYRNMTQAAPLQLTRERKGADRTIAAGPQVHLASRLALVTPAPTHDSRGDNGNKSKRAQHGKGGVVGAVTGVGRCCRRLGSSRRDCGHLRGIVLHVARKLALLGLSTSRVCWMASSLVAKASLPSLTCLAVSRTGSARYVRKTRAQRNRSCPSRCRSP